jgi:hypothetical protein
MAFRVASSASESFGTWDDAEFVQVAIYRHSENYLLPGSSSWTAIGNNTNLFYRDLLGRTNQQHYGGGWVVAMAGINRTGIGEDSPPAGTVERHVFTESGGSMLCFDTNENVSFWTEKTVSLSENGFYVSGVIGLYDTGISKSTGGSSRPVSPFSQQVIG